MKKLFLLILGLIFVLGSVLIFLTRTAEIEKKIKIIQINGTVVEVEIADALDLREKGLSDRISLKQGKGILFVFDTSAQYGFWMKDMIFPIDIVWIDEKFNVVDIDKGVSPETFPQVFRPDQEVKYVLELPAGYTNQHLIDTSAVVQF